jgi:C4-dicarboxylate transporter DctM subunit
MLFATVSGTSIATALAFGNLLAPAMKKDGYTPEFIAALQACGGTIGPIIPPSVLFIMYASISGVSVGSLFLAGVLPGIMMGVSLMIVSFFMVRKRDITKSLPMPIGQRFIETFKAIPALLMPVIIIGGTLSGFSSPSEAGTVACIYALIVGIFFYKGLKLRDLPKLFGRAAMSACAAFMMLGFAGVMNYTLTRLNFGRIVAEFLRGIVSSGTGLLLIIAIFLLVLCTLMDSMPALVIFVPVLYPLAAAFGVNPLHLALVIVTCLVIGQVTPPVGILLSVTTQLHGVPMQKSFRDLWPMLIALIACLFISLFVPQFSTWLPSLLI